MRILLLLAQNTVNLLVIRCAPLLLALNILILRGESKKPRYGGFFIEDC